MCSDTGGREAVGSYSLLVNTGAVRVHPGHIDTCVPVGRDEDAGANAQRISRSLFSSHRQSRQNGLRAFRCDPPRVMHLHTTKESGNRGHERTGWARHGKERCTSFYPKCIRRVAAEDDRRVPYRFSSLTRPNFSSVRHCGDHARNIFAPHPRPSRFHAPPSFPSLLYEHARNGCLCIGLYGIACIGVYVRTFLLSAFARRPIQP